ncbi:serine-rich coiled-coil domain-containing protein 2 isoform X1 [Rhineura floridana]|uniref:serine-rich coiled-coil domain-containing protein 2 isoform X1 n=1 Tax=Rhineura floridana TaxID=261503 RepID=UPI002AC7FC24|nr:serine-rich coiled-coil domain-containing protein 2 isoform X1 [Rhineura floridana]XP_061491033.1 serine-rich coiled-coil domain-containing protein 2 isoform X1 [Rhineura floridana]XP_061491034.1 serine-rich coiled-coil domain-containing protein 2 isoform X1 [Rhineura floridana]XP_061491035.1 serine-rich coiled-coil domain-containing protein 2 isoform X1 [Rhineura floridana]XP_061491037.1 serine-rich coiled-coil domain-containing protein 2 isoform X1 [Rhineura floridana]XP_061491038.1 serin
MEEKKYIRTSLVSRLPKYGTKPAGNILQTVPNGTALNLSGNTQSIDKKIGKHNGTIRMPSFSFNWQKSNQCQLGDQISSESGSSHNSNERLTNSEKCPQSEEIVGKELPRVGSNSTSSKIEKQSNMFVSPTEELNQKSLHGLSSSAKYTKSSLLGRTSYSGLHAPKSHLNGICGSRSTIGLQRNRGNSTATRTSLGVLGESLAKSIDNDKSSCEKMVRSQSFSHSIQSSLLPSATLTRSHSFNRAVDLTRPYQNQYLTIRTSQRSGLLSRSARQLDVPNGNEPLKYGFARSYAALGSPGLKKQPLLNGSGDAPSLRFRTGRPSLLKPSIQHLGRKIPVDGSTSKNMESCIEEDSVSTNITGGIDAKGMHNSERTEDGKAAHNNVVDNSCKSICMDGDVDEISISSLSSSEKNDLSEDFSDDFIDLEDPNRTINVQEEEGSVQQLEHGSGIPLDPFLPLKKSERSNFNSDEWLNICLSVVDDKSESAKHPAGNNIISSDLDYRAGSSFELSPSDSSDGTYMWDEEGLEPIGSVLPCRSYDSSEMNSLDILNNLDSCDLEDDDLMLDVDLPEDVPCDNVDCENMNRYDRPDRNIRQQKEGLWKRTPQRWNSQDHYHLGHSDHYSHSRNDLNRGFNYFDSPPAGHLEGYGAPDLYPPLRSLPANTVMLDEMTLRHMVQDCTAVKTQLLKMKRILNQNDENVSLHNITLSVPSSPELQESEPIYKTDDLLNEITQLKEDLKKKDETIKQLEHRLSIRCVCNRDSQKSEQAVCTYADKYTQTSWRKSAPQVLQPSSHLPRFTDLAQGKLIKTSLIVAHSEPSEDQQRSGGHEYQNAADGSFNSLNELSTLNTQLNVRKSEENAHSTKNVKVRENPKELTGRKFSTLRSHPSSQSSSQVNTQEVQTKLVLKKHCSQTNQASPPKTSRATKTPKQNALVPPPVTVAAPSPNGSASKELEQLPPSSLTQLQTASSQSELSHKSQKTSKLRPPTASFRPKQMTNPKIMIPPEPQNACSKTTRSRQLTQAKENMQKQDSNIHSGDSVASNRHSRLPKPKT